MDTNFILFCFLSTVALAVFVPLIIFGVCLAHDEVEASDLFWWL